MHTHIIHITTVNGHFGNLEPTRFGSFKHLSRMPETIDLAQKPTHLLHLDFGGVIPRMTVRAQTALGRCRSIGRPCQRMRLVFRVLSLLHSPVSLVDRRCALELGTRGGLGVHRSVHGE